MGYIKHEVKPTAIGSVMNNLAFEAHMNAVKHGFYEDVQDLTDYMVVNDRINDAKKIERDFTLAQLAKIMAECGEAVAAIQNGDDYELREELADIVIRVFDLSGFLGAPIGDIIVAKMKFNQDRPYKHGKKC